MEKQREIKFRAYNEKRGIMACPCYVEIFKDGSFSAGETNRYPNTWHSDENVTLMQYTGLKDKNGNEIYEGDIIVQDRYPFFESGKSNYVGVVEWVFSQWQYVLRVVAKDKRGISDGINCSMNDTGFEEGEKTDFEVIGNIYENPSLLK